MRLVSHLRRLERNTAVHCIHLLVVGESEESKRDDLSTTKHKVRYEYPARISTRHKLPNPISNRNVLSWTWLFMFFPSPVLDSSPDLPCQHKYSCLLSLDEAALQSLKR